MCNLGHVRYPAPSYCRGYSSYMPPPYLIRWLSALAAYSAAKRSGEKAARRGSSTMTARRICFSLLSLKRSTVSTTSLYLKVGGGGMCDGDGSRNP